MKEERDWETEEDVRTLMEYQKLIKDKKRMEKAETMLSEKQKDIDEAQNGLILAINKSKK